jgi:REP element-mobilizing transposase RayT
MPLTRRRRDTLRLSEYDYSQTGAYFTTICTKSKKPFFNGIQLVEIAQTSWHELPAKFPTIELDTFAVLPNHIHFIVSLNPASQEKEDTPRRGAINCAPTSTASPIGQHLKIDRQRPTIGQIVRTYKAIVTHRIRQVGWIEFAWQRNYFKRIIRREHTLNAIRSYIDNNPARWHLDRYNPDAIGEDPETAILWSMLEKEKRS